MLNKGVFEKLDFWTITDQLDEMIDYDMNGNEKSSPYYDHYEDQIREMSILAADLWQELQGLKSKIWQYMPWKKIEFCDEDECSQTAIAWFNTAACMISDIDMPELLENENIYEYSEWSEKQKRIKALSRATKEQQMRLYTDVIGFITRYLQLRCAFDVITGTISELEYHNSFTQNANGEFEATKTAYL